MLLSRSCMLDCSEETHPWRAECELESMMTRRTICYAYSLRHRCSISISISSCFTMAAVYAPRVQPQPASRSAELQPHERQVKRAISSPEASAVSAIARGPPRSTAPVLEPPQPIPKSTMQPTVARMAQGTMLGKKFPAPVSTFEPRALRNIPVWSRGRRMG